MAFGRGSGWDQNESYDVNLGAVAGAIRCRLALPVITRLIRSFVNSQGDNFYGSNRVDCRYTLRRRSGFVGSLSREADPAKTARRARNNCRASFVDSSNRA